MIILDTNTLIWWTTAPEKISKQARKIIEKAEDQTILISSVSIWEVYLLIKKNKLRFTVDVDLWLEKIETLPSFRFVAIDNTIAAQSVKLPDLDSKDSADRIIIATALQYGATIITADKRILNYPQVQSVW